MAYNAIDIARKIVSRTDVEQYAAIERDIEKDGQPVVIEEINTDGYGRVVLTDAMRESLAKAQESLAQGRFLTEEMFQTRFAKWL